MKRKSIILAMALGLFSGCAPQSGLYGVNNNVSNGAINGAITAATASVLLGGGRSDIIKSAGVGAAVGAVGAILSTPQQ